MAWWHAVNWQDRLRKTISLVSPTSKTRFIAGWSSNDITGTKRVGVFQYPLVDGTLTQDLGYSSREFPLTLYFEGDDNDIIASQFQAAFAERGAWTINHPVLGQIVAQPTGAVKLSVDPTSSGNITVATTSWIETTIAAAQQSVQELASTINGQAAQSQSDSAAQFIAGTDLTDPAASVQTAETGTAIASLFNSSPIGKLIAATSDLAGKSATAYNTLTADLQAATIDPAKIATDVQTFVSLGAIASGDFPSLVTASLAFVQSVVEGYLPSGNNGPAKNQVEIAELYAVSGMIAVSQLIANSVPSTRDACVNAATNIASQFNAMVAALDAIQTNFFGVPLTGQYFSTLGVYADLAILLGLSIQYLLTILFDLKIARVVTLDRPKTTIGVAIEQYGSEYDSQVNDNYQYLIDTNHLTGRDVIILSAGREITIYEAVA